MKEFTLRVAPAEAGIRLDLYLLRFAQLQHLDLSRNFIQKLICQKRVILEGEAPNAHYKVKTGQIFRLQIPEQASLEIGSEDIPLDIRFEDEDLVVVNKPAGMVVHPGAGNCQGTLVNSLLFHCPSLSSINPQRPGIVHRLDKDTSGLIVVAKNNLSHHHLSRQFAEHSILRQYVALVKGKVRFNEDVIELPIGRHPRQREKMSVFAGDSQGYDKASSFAKASQDESADSPPNKSRRRLNTEGRRQMSVGFSNKHKYAKTRYRVIKRKPDITLLELTPFTGRTHQLRVHMSFIGHPILGDKKYGRNTNFRRLALHAHRLGFIHPRLEKFVELKTDIPEEFLKAVA
ncbi:MAG: RluA family pseudouridine synthase [Candidatus Omnitrophica bacterium]|nr:RluA family pseudouridine synthase [Candidatus Omnitrophota bacterium]